MRLDSIADGEKSNSEKPVTHVTASAMTGGSSLTVTASAEQMPSAEQEWGWF